MKPDEQSDEHDIAVYRDRYMAEIEDSCATDAGLLEPGQPTYAAHLRHVAAMGSELTPQERRMVRYLLGLRKQSEESDGE